MLRDPRLLFSGGRIADDLAKRWNIEQLNLLSAPFIQPLRTLEPDHLHFPSISGKLSSITVVDGYTSHSGHLSELQTSGGYFEKEGSSDGYEGRHHSTKAYVRHQNHGRAQILRQSSSEKLPGDLGSSSAGTNLPHWLRGAPHSDQRAAPARHHLGGQLSPPPGRNSPGEALKRRVLGRRSAGSLEDLNQRALPHEPKSSEEPIFSLNRSRSEPMGQIDLVDLDSDASSEGTISDDQSSGR
ncbi:unnamed protein product [Spirodela intermedia]|uniref:Uncharacterized protein n=1 Tax=Spirodela intermedia TaxID=51605 RepID=A0A7I8KMF9_SPIIN|nr:unnamed protein product [Spirodela intermedia]